jgi:uroporphyrinogen III methyltransferase / synthase
MTVRPGTVYLVGAGPGAPGLITVRGLELLRRADVVLHDRLVDEGLLAESPTSAMIVDVGKGAEGESSRQEAINALLVRHARAHRVVVRLKGGDPLVYGRGWEEREACRVAGIPCEIVPGVSSALAAPAAVNIPVTLRGVASSVAIVAAPVAGDAQLECLTKADTGIVLMGVDRLADLTSRLVASGHDPQRPVAVVERATLPGQRVFRSTLAYVASEARAAGVQAPAVVVIGPTAALGTGDGPLAGRRIVVTRPHDASHELTQRLRASGADVLGIPLIEIVPREVRDVDLSQRLRDYDWIVFSSRHGVRGFRRFIEGAGLDTRRLAHVRLAAVGPITARELESWGLRPDVVPDPARADALVAALRRASPRPRRVLFPCGTLALDMIPEALGSDGVEVDRLIVYETRLRTIAERDRDAIERGVDAVLLASPSAATALGESGVALGGAALICIGPTTADAARHVGWTDVQVASVHSDAGLVALVTDVLSGVRA